MSVISWKRMGLHESFVIFLLLMQKGSQSFKIFSYDLLRALAAPIVLYAVVLQACSDVHAKNLVAED